MAQKVYEIADVGTVIFSKKRGQKSIRIRVDTAGIVRVSAPWSASAKYALGFVSSKLDWINSQRRDVLFKPYNGMYFAGKQQLKIIENSVKLRTRKSIDGLDIYVPGKYSQAHNVYISKAIIRVLRVEAEKELITRIYNIARTHNFTYRSVTIKQLTGRWGSCDSKGNISLSLFLVQLPADLRNYVMIHELVHTNHMNHSSAFWKSVESFYPDYKSARRRMRDLRPRIYDTAAMS